MSANDTPVKRDPPIETVRDGQTFIKVWRNWSKDGTPYYNTTLGYTYTDTQGQPRESRSLRDSDLLKLPELAPRAREVIRNYRAQDRPHEQTHAPQQDERYQSGGDYQDRQAPPDQQRFRQSRGGGQQRPAPDYSREP